MVFGDSHHYNLCGDADEAAKHKHSPQKEEINVIESESSSKEREESNNVILGEKNSEKEEKKVENQGTILSVHNMNYSCFAHLCSCVSSLMGIAEKK